jgi:hypothetical protein
VYLSTVKILFLSLLVSGVSRASSAVARHQHLPDVLHLSLIPDQLLWLNKGVAAYIVLAVVAAFTLFSPTRHYQNKLSTRILQPPGQDWTRHLIQYQAFEALCTPDPGCSTAILHPSSQHTNATGGFII